MISRTKTTLAHCPKCNGDREADVVAEHSETFNSEAYDANTLYRILKCRGCGHTHFQTVSTNSEDVDQGYDEATGEPVEEYVETIRYFPSISKRPRPDWASGHASYSPIMEHLLDEAYGALNANLPIVAAIALRTVFDAATEALGIDTELSFKKKLEQLVIQGNISSTQRDALDALTNAGSAAAHRGWQPTESELDTMFSIMESFIYQAFVLSLEQKELAKRAAVLRQGTPKRRIG